jgi:hypothetical protein
MKQKGQTQRLSVRCGHSTETDEIAAVRDLARQIDQPDPSLVVFFASSRYDLERLETELRQAFKGPVIGCTTSGEITPAGFAEGTLAGFSVSSDELTAQPYLVQALRRYDGEEVAATVARIQTDLARLRREQPEASSFGLLLVDGLCVREEQLVAQLASVARDLPIVGGSAGDDLALEATHVYTDGRFHPDAAVFTLISTTLPFTPIKTQHFTATDKRMVITRATPERRVVHEINGRPAGEEYARVVGVDLDALDPMVFSTYPVMLRLGGEYYVRSIQRLNPDGSLTFFCAIDEGLVLRVAQGENLVHSLEAAFEAARIDVPEIKLTIGCDCVLRRIEVLNKGLEQQVGEIMRRNNVIGFHTYGEQFNSVHVNQTFTGVALGDS